MPEWLQRHGGSEKRLVDAIRRDLMCLAAREGMVDLIAKPKKFSDFVPHALYCPET